MERTLPSDLDAERATLGALLLDRDAIVAVAPWLRPDDFYLDKHRWIYSAILSCYQRRVPPDVVMVATELREREQLAEVGDLAGLTEMAGTVPTSYHVEYYGRTVAHTALCRRIIDAGRDVARLGYNDDLDEQDLIAEVMAVVTGALQSSMRSSVAELDTGVDDLLEVMHRGVAPGISTGLTGLDQKLGGLHAGDLLILAARPSVGKSALALQLALNVARADNRVLVASLEMDRQSLIQRLLAIVTGYDLSRIRRHELGDGELPRLMEAAGRLRQLPIAVDDGGTLTTADLRTRALRYMSERGTLGLLVLDYLQLMSAPGHKGNRVAEVGDISRGLKQLAVELKCPVLALSQLNRGVEARPSKVPNLADLRESGSIEADADVVMFIYRDELYNASSATKGIAEIHIAKHRQGPLGIVPLAYTSSNGRWTDAGLTRYASGVAA